MKFDGTATSKWCIRRTDPMPLGAKHGLGEGQTGHGRKMSKIEFIIAGAVALALCAGIVAVNQYAAGWSSGAHLATAEEILGKNSSSVAKLVSTAESEPERKAAVRRAIEADWPWAPDYSLVPEIVAVRKDAKGYVVTLESDGRRDNFVVSP